MRWNTIALFVMATILTACHHVKPTPATSADLLQEFQHRAAKFHSVVTIPTFETTTNEIQTTGQSTIAAGNAALDRIGKLGAGEVTFANTGKKLQSGPPAGNGDGANTAAATGR